MRTGRTVLMAMAALPVISAGAPARAEVVSAEAGGLSVRTVLTVAAPPEAVYAALLVPGRWWNPAHSHSGDAANMTLDPRIGGCFCEAAPQLGGRYEHLRVIALVPGRLVRMSGALGPFQPMAVTGTLNWELKPVEGGTELRQTYALAGHIPGGGTAMAAAVDGAMGGQAVRLKAFAEGK